MKSDLETTEKIAELAVNALIMEVELSPKPGLVDSIDNGAHQDMNIELFKISAKSLEKSFREYVLCGYGHLGDLESLLAKLRVIGKNAEKEMFSATDGINTHKGANFTFGLILAALGQQFSRSGTVVVDEQSIREIFGIVEKIAGGVVKADFKNLNSKQQLTYGERLYLEHKIGGIRQEAALGYPTIVSTGLPNLLALKKRDITDQQIYLEILFLLMENTEDSNILSRGGSKGLEHVKNTAHKFLKAGGVCSTDYLESIRQINRDFIGRNLSPGGCADLLSVVIFIDLLMKTFDV